jgi:hypothetical protein
MTDHAIDPVNWGVWLATFHQAIPFLGIANNRPIDDAGGVPRELMPFFGIELDWLSTAQTFLSAPDLTSHC